MNRDLVFLLGGSVLIVLLIILNLLIWIRPEAVMKKNVGGSDLLHSGLATALAVTLFLSCFLMGVWMSVLKLQGKLGVYL